MKGGGRGSWLKLDWYSGRGRRLRGGRGWVLFLTVLWRTLHVLGHAPDSIDRS